MEEYKPTETELKLQARFTFEGSMHTWTLAEKGQYLKYLNNRAGLPFGTIGMIRTEHKKDGATTVKEIPYASRQTTVELGRKHKISLQQMKESIEQAQVRYTYRATDIDTGRFVEAVGACSLMGWGKPLSDDQRANKVMHAETKAKRRATLEVCGLAFLDDTEVDDMEGATRINVETGEVEQAPKGNGKPAERAANISSPSAPLTHTQSASASVAASDSPIAPPSEPPKQAAGTPPAAPAPVVVAQPATASTGSVTVDVPARYTALAPLFTAETLQSIVADKAHMDLIVNEAKTNCGWDGPTMSAWLFDTFGVRGNNSKETLTLEVFGKIMAGIDLALTNAGR